MNAKMDSKRPNWRMKLVLLFSFYPALATESVEKHAPYEARFEAGRSYGNPYTDLSADAVLTEPGGRTRRSVPLFWDGGSTWKFRFSPDKTGNWTWAVSSADPGLNGKTGSLSVVESKRAGAIRPMRGFPYHFERQDGKPFWFMGDTAWALYTDSAEERHDRTAAMRYIDARASQGFNVLHSMLLSEAGWGNQGGLPFLDIGADRINPAYWREVDVRLAYASSKGIVCGLALAWGDKRKIEPFAWRLFSSVESRKRYARYIAARYSAYDVYFIVSGEWHAEIRTRGSTEEEIRKEFIAIGDALASADPHGRMIAIHPMTARGSVREFNEASWMSFGDYQQNYRDLHERILDSRRFNKPVVNSEYGYYLRDQNGDGVPDKDNSTSLESMRHATWDTVMAGGYVVTGFGTTYFGGNRDPGPFNPDAEKNDAWEKQIGEVRGIFGALEWWKLEPHDELIRSETARGKDSEQLNRIAPPRSVYWCLAEPGRRYIVYVRGLRSPVRVSLEQGGPPLRARQIEPRTGQATPLAFPLRTGDFEYRPPDESDWIVVLEAAEKGR